MNNFYSVLCWPITALTILCGVLFLPVAACAPMQPPELRNRLLLFNEVSWPSPPITIETRDFGVENKTDPRFYQFPEGVIEFAADSSPYLLFFWYPPEHPQPHLWKYEKRIGKKIVFDFNGKFIDATVDNNRYLKPEFQARFPQVAYREKFQVFLNDAKEWGFSRDWRYGLAMKNDTEILDSDTWYAELWDLQDEPEQLWRVHVPSFYQGPCWIEFLEWRGSQCIFVSLPGNEAMVLDQNNGKLINTIILSKQDTDDDEREYKARIGFRRKFGGHDDFHFDEISMAFDPATRLLALGDVNSPRIRIISIDQPGVILKELNYNECPVENLDAITAANLRFEGGGKYLKVSYNSGAGDGGNPTDIYEVGSWRLCWSGKPEQAAHAAYATISPDASMIAMLNGYKLEYGPFVPHCVEK